MAVITINNVYKSFGTFEVLQDITFSINKNDKIAIIGDNGEGKTTLLKILMRQLEVDKGNVFIEDGNTIGYLSQQVISNEDNTLLQEMELAFDKIKKIELQMNDLIEQMNQNSTAEIVDKYSNLHDTYTNLGGYEYHYLIQQMLFKFGFNEAYYQRKLSTFSGGEKTRASFVKLLLNKPSILILDEPTNHLDLVMIEWLERYLKTYNGTVIIVSHDQVFIDHLVNKVVEIENHHATVFSGNYTYYLNEKQLRFEQAMKAYNLQEKEIKRYDMLIRKFKPKPTKTAFAQSLEKKLEKMEKIEKPQQHKKTIHAKFEANLEPYSVKMHICEDLLFGYDNKPLTKPLNLIIKNQDKICIMGQNGSGKTTLLKCLMNNEHLISGFNSDVRLNLKYFYFDQHQQILNPELSLFDTIHNEFPLMTNTEVRNILGRFLFEDDDAFKLVQSLSGGEKIRMIFALISLRNYDILYLDEPTNHLDFTTKRIISDILEDYPGTIIMVSHDRYFVNRVANKIIYLHNKEFFIEEGNYDNFIKLHDFSNLDSTFMKTKEEKNKNEKNVETKKTPSINKTKEKVKLEKELDVLMLKLEECNIKINDETKQYNWVEYRQMNEEIKQLEEKIEMLMVKLENLNA